MQKKIRFITLLAMIVFIGISSACGSSPAEPTEAPQDEEAAPSQADGKTILEERCSTCHGLGRTEQAEKTEGEWEQTVTRMVNKGAELNTDEQAILVEYLAENYGP